LFWCSDTLWVEGKRGDAMNVTDEVLRLLREVEDRRRKPGGGAGREDFETHKRELMGRLAERLADRLPKGTREPEA
jgi:hypothetical protein